jgi:hypothetical protein
MFLGLALCAVGVVGLVLSFLAWYFKKVGLSVKVRESWVPVSVEFFTENARKAFDMVEWTELFTSLVKRGVHPIFLRVLLYVYKNQQCDVKWAGKYSHRFAVSNGVRQGAVSSPFLHLHS